MRVTEQGQGWSVRGGQAGAAMGSGACSLGLQGVSLEELWRPPCCAEPFELPNDAQCGNEGGVRQTSAV